MTQFNMHNQLNEFYEEHVRLKDEINRLRSLRDTNLNRLSAGLESLGKPNFIKSILQGSIAMHTANKALNNDYDIDIAVIFEKDDLPASAIDARKRVAEALNQKAYGFTKEPEARTNAVTVWYSDGYHVDIAVYRRSENSLGIETLEHAGPDWSERDPKAITNWFISSVKRLSPSQENRFHKPKVSTEQMRRVVRWIKCFTKAREGWNLPGGLIISILVEECYQPDSQRDDVALYNTLQAIKSRLDISCTVHNPTNRSSELTEQPKFLNQVINLRKRLDSALIKLKKLFAEDCDQDKARKAWNYLFQHPFWESATAAASKSAANDSAYTVSLEMNSSKKENGILTARNISSDRVLPKKIHLRFDATTNVPEPFTVKWQVINTGDEAESANDSGHIATSTSLKHWEHTAYRGRHEMICEIIKDGEVVASTRQQVNIR